MSIVTQPAPYPKDVTFPPSEGGARPKRKYNPTPVIDACIADAYRRQRQGDRRAVKLTSAKLGWPAHAVSKRASELGLVRIKERPWSPEEERIIFRFGHLPYSAMQRKLAESGFARSRTAVAVKATRLRIKSNLEGYSATSLAAAFGVDSHKVLGWISRGLLEASRRGTCRRPEQGGDTWWISRDQVKRFIMRCPEEIDLARVEKFWFLDLLTDGKICR